LYENRACPSHELKTCKAKALEPYPGHTAETRLMKTQKGSNIIKFATDKENIRTNYRIL
jgi:hypothetical protein